MKKVKQRVRSRFLLIELLDKSRPPLRIEFTGVIEGSSCFWDGGIVGGCFARQGNKYFVKGQVRHSFKDAALLSVRLQREKYVCLRMEVDEFFKHYE